MNFNILESLEKDDLALYLNKLSPKVSNFLNACTKRFSLERNEIIAKITTIIAGRHIVQNSFNDLDMLKEFLKTVKAPQVTDAYFWNANNVSPVFEQHFDKLYICLFNSILDRSPNHFILVSQNGKMGIRVIINAEVLKVEKWGLA